MLGRNITGNNNKPQSRSDPPPCLRNLEIFTIRVRENFKERFKVVHDVDWNRSDYTRECED